MNSQNNNSKAKLKIAIVYDMIYPFNIGGAELRNYEIAKRLSKQHEVHMFGVKLWKGNNILKKDKIHYHGISRYKEMYNFKGQRTILEPIKYSIALYKELKKHKFDIIDCSAFPYFPCLACRLAKNNAKFIITWHQYWDDYWFTYLGKIKGFFGFLIEKLVKYLTNHHIAVSKKTKKDLKLKNIPIIYNGIDPKEIEKIKPAKESSDLIYVGRLITGKNIDLLIKSIALLKNKPKTIIIGDGPEKEKLIKLTKKLNLQKNIKFLGFIEKQRIYSYLKSSKIFVFPSTLEGFGMVVIEANACKLPVIVVKHKWNAAIELIKNNGLIIENSEKKMAKTIFNLLKNKNLRKKFGLNGYEKVKKEFDWNTQCKNLINYYKSVLKDS